MGRKDIDALKDERHTARLCMLIVRAAVIGKLELASLISDQSLRRVSFPAIMAYLAPIHRGTSVRHAIKLNILSPDEESLVLA